MGMRIYVVYSTAQQETKTGVISDVTVRTKGAFTSSMRANRLADKVGGHVVEMDVDVEYEAKQIAWWKNPGYLK